MKQYDKDSYTKLEPSKHKQSKPVCVNNDRIHYYYHWQVEHTKYYL